MSAIQKPNRNAWTTTSAPPNSTARIGDWPTAESDCSSRNEWIGGRARNHTMAAGDTVNTWRKAVNAAHIPRTARKQVTINGGEVAVAHRPRAIDTPNGGWVTPSTGGVRGSRRGGAARVRAARGSASSGPAVVAAGVGAGVGRPAGGRRRRFRFAAIRPHLPREPRRAA